MGGTWGRILGACGLLLACVAGFGALAAGTSDQDPPILFTADRLIYDRDLDVITARGNVEVSREDTVLLADTVSFNQRIDQLTASGNVSLIQPGGDVIFGEYMELTGDLKDGIIEDLRLLLVDGSRFAASGGRRSNADIIELRNAVYSPCNLCIEDPSRPPLWQVKAVKVVNDRRTKMLEYTDAWIEIWGVPVIYTPYLAHPDPTVKRRSGFLTPSIGNSSDLGTIVKIPYFVNIAPNIDATLSPFVTSEEGPVFAAEYRHSLAAGELNLRGSVTRDSTDDLRGHIAGFGRLDLNRTWRAGFDVNRVSDDTYMRRYGFSADVTSRSIGTRQFITSRIFTEGFRKRNYVSVDALGFQSLEEGVDGATIPIVVPMLNFNHVGEPDRLGGRTDLDVSLLALSRDRGRDTRRLSLKGGWKAPFLGPMGSLYTASASLQGDVYHVTGQAIPGRADSFDGVSGRIFPRIGLDWRFPLVSGGGSVQQVIEPIASFIYSPNGGNSNKIPNEDSLDLEFDGSNLFSPNRFTGVDKVEGGARVNYGIKWGLYGEHGGSTTILVGQRYRPRTDSTFAQNSGLEDKLSDIVANVHVSPGEGLEFLYRTRLSRDNFEAQRNEINMSAGVPALNFGTNYVFFDRAQDSPFPGREEISLTVNSQLTRYWRTSFSALRDLEDNGGLRFMSLNVTYENECCVLGIEARRTFFEDRDLRPTDSIVARLLFKTLGEVKTDVN